MITLLADDPAAVIEEAIQHLDLRKHHLNAVGVQFVQIGDEDGAEAALKRLKECPSRVSNHRTLFTVPCFNVGDRESI